MKKRLLLFALVSLFVSAAAVSCKDDVDEQVVFELYDDDDNLVEGVQSLEYGEVREYVLKSSNVQRVSVTGPKGWGCEFYTGAKQAIITAPNPADATAATGGTITVDITGRDGSAQVYTMEVTAYEGNVSLQFVPALTETQSFPFSTTKTYTIATSNVQTLVITKPAGWEVTYDLESDPQKLTIAAPAADSGADETGTVAITPKSAKGTVGTVVNVPVELKITMPSLGLTETAFEFTSWGEVKPQAIVPLNVESHTVKSQPEGWTIELDIENSLLKMTAPANGNDPATEGSGDVVIEIENGTGDKDEVTVSLRLKVPGIATAQDFIEFGAAVTAGTAVPERFIIGGEVTQVLSFDLSGYDNLTFVGDKTNKFAGTYNGNGKTVKIDISIPEDGLAGGLFHTVAAGAKIKNLTVAGAILTKSKVTNASVTGDNITISAVASFNEGAEMTDVTTDVAFTFKPGAYTALKNNTWACYGSMSGLVTGDATFTGCVSKGRVHLDLCSMRSVGGQVGIIYFGTKVKLTDCENQGEMLIDLGDDKANAADNTMYAGLVANSELAETEYVRCINRGNITIDSHNLTEHAAVRQVFAVGGIAGSSYGKFTDCENYGKIYGREGTAESVRRYGGILGAAYPSQLAAKPTGWTNNSLELYMTDCTNHGDIIHTSAYGGGIAGQVTNTKYAHVKGCVNKGNITNPTIVPDITDADTDAEKTAKRNRMPTAFGGLFTEYRGDLIEDCVNEGNISGQCQVQAAGIVARGRYHYTNSNTYSLYMKNCVNKGNLDISTIKGYEVPTSSAHLVVAGVIVTQDGKWHVEDCSNTGTITTKVEAAGRTKNVYYVRTGTGTGGSVVPEGSTEANQGIMTYINETVIQ